MLEEALSRLSVVPDMEAMTETASDEVRNVCRSGEVSETVVTAVAEAKGVDPLDLNPLYNVVDPDALNSMFRPTVGSPPSSMELQFSMAGCQVVVHGDGEVVVTTQTTNDEITATIAPHQD